MKSIFKSKTIWLNILTMASTIFLPGVQKVISTHPAVSAGLVTAANMILRTITSQSVGLTSDPYKS